VQCIVGSDKKYPFIIIRGISGTGKSTAATHLCTNYKYRLVDPDLVKTIDLLFFLINPRNLFDFIKYRSIKTLKYRYNLKIACNHLGNNGNVVWTQMFSNINGLDYTIRKVRKSLSCNLKVLIINTECSKELIVKRCSNKSWISTKRVEQLQYLFEEVHNTTSDNTSIVSINNNSNSRELYEKLNKIMLNIS